ncbi:MAG: dihydrolipoyl dehydrogenase [Ferrimicrobium sp.]
MVVGEFTQDADLLVIGGGPGGYTAALRGAQLGRTVTLVERESLGGVCLNVGCIPSKALIELSHRFGELPALAKRGVLTDGARIDRAAIAQACQVSVERLTSGVAQLLRAADVEIVDGTAVFSGAREVRIQAPHETSKIRFRDCIVATGSRPRGLDGFEVDHVTVLDSTDLLFRREPLNRLIVIGGGYVGLELGTAYAKLGTKVTIVESLAEILSGVEPEIQRTLRTQLRALGVEVITKAVLGELVRTDDGCSLALSAKDVDHSIEADAVAVLVGRLPNVDEVGLSAVGVAVGTDGRVVVDATMATTTPHIYAIGDIVPGPMLAHKAYFEAKVAAEAASGMKVANDAQVIPAVVFCEPEVATVGVGEEAAREAYGEIVVGRFPFRANGRAVVLDAVQGEVKVIADAASSRIVGVHIVGPEASNLIGEAVLAIELGATLEDIALTIHPHPTLSEALPEAVEVALGRPTHLIVQRKASKPVST